MPRERKGAKNKAAAVAVDHHHDGTEPPVVKAPKKRRGSAANSNAMRVMASNVPSIANNQNGDAIQFHPPQPGSGYGDTIHASNPFDDTQMCPPHQQPGMHPVGMNNPMSQHGLSMMNSGGGMMPGNPRMMGPGGMMGCPRGMPPNMPGGPKPPMMGGPTGMPPGIPSGRTYPPDQSMVFNSANPNAPPICPCGCCHKEIHDNDQAILCESGCNFWYHRICVGLSERAYTLINQEVYAEWVCDNCLNNKNIPLIKFKS